MPKIKSEFDVTNKNNIYNLCMNLITYLKKKFDLLTYKSFDNTADMHKK